MPKGKDTLLHHSWANISSLQSSSCLMTFVQSVALSSVLSPRFPRIPAHTLSLTGSSLFSQWKWKRQLWPVGTSNTLAWRREADVEFSLTHALKRGTQLRQWRWPSLSPSRSQRWDNQSVSSFHRTLALPLALWFPIVLCKPPLIKVFDYLPRPQLLTLPFR